MFKQILKQIRNKVRDKHYVMIIHAEEEMNADDLSIYDVECVILTGEIL